MNTIERSSSNKNVAAIYPLTPMQEGMLFHTLQTPDSSLYFEQLCCTLQGELDIPKFEAAWQQVADRHGVLRTAFIWENVNQPLQVVGKVVNLPWLHQDWRGQSAAAQQAQLAEFLGSDRARGFQLSQAPLMRFALLRVAEDRFHLVWSYHHLLIDGWSLPLLMQEVFAYYEAALQGETLSLSQPRPYRDYVLWRAKQDPESANRFWQGYLQGVVAPTPLPIKLNGPAKPPLYQAIEQPLSPEITGQLQEFARCHQLTLNTVFQGVWALLLARYAGESAALFGATVSGRPPALAGVESMVGLFINTVPVRITIPADCDILSWLRHIQQQQLEAQSYDYSSLVDIQGVSAVPRGLPLFESLLVFENYPISESLQEQQLSLEIVDIQSIEQTNYPLTMVVIPGNQITIQANYDAHQFEPGVIERLLGHLQTLLQGVLAHPTGLVTQLPLCTASEQAAILAFAKATANAQWQGQPQPPDPRCLHQVFEQQVTHNPAQIAVVEGTAQVTYGELNRRANQLAHELQAQGVGPEVLVGLCLERSIDLIVGMVAIIKAGGAYVPLDPAYPAERLAGILADTGLSILLTQRALLDQLPAVDRPICLDEFAYHGSDENLDVSPAPTNLAYIIYTSGSTGTPKGVMIPQQGITRLVLDTNYIQLTASDRIAQASNPAFDAATFEIWGALLNGAQLVIVPRRILLSAGDLAELLPAQNISVLFLTTALFNQMATLVPSAFQSVRCLLMGGEAIDPNAVRLILAAGGPEQLLHVYGPTESTTFTSWQRISTVTDTATTIPIGRPIAQTEIYILDPARQPVPIGIPGELYIGGNGLARGYWQRPELTASQFITQAIGSRSATRLYKTGDLVCYTPQGEIEYLGRIDNQVKIRGFRIELGEIEAVLNQHPTVQQTSVQAITTKTGQKQLVAYLVTAAGAAPPVAELRQFLAARLPEYMIPLAYIPLISLPLTPNGKVDRRALPEADLTAVLASEYVAPQTELEIQLAQIWQAVLGLERVGVTDNFFELGGHSLLATQLVSRIRKSCQVDLSIQTLFTAPTIAALAQEIAQVQGVQDSLPLVRVDRNQMLPLSFAQQRLWFLQQLDPESRAYHIPGALRLQGKLDIGALQGSFQAIEQRHESLRTNFGVTAAGQPYQIIRTQGTLLPEPIDLSHLTGADQAAAVLAARAVVDDTLFDLSSAAPWRVQLLRLGAADYLLLFCMHHIVADGWSMGVLTQELASYYRAAVTGQALTWPELPIQYADFAHWQRQLLAGELREQQLNYWQQQLANLPAALELPTDRPRPAVQTFRGAQYEFSLGQELSQALTSLSRQQGTTLFMTLLAAFQVLLYRYTGQSDLAVGSPIANRNRAEIEGLIGFFVNTLVLRTDLGGQPTFRELLDRVRATTLAAYAHQDLPFELVVEAQQQERDLSHSPLFQVMFVLQNAPDRALQLPELTLSAVSQPSPIAKFDLTLSCAEPLEGEAGAGLTGLWEYNTDLFDRETIAALDRHFQQLLGAIVKNIDGPITQFPLLSAPEYAQMITASQGVSQPVPQDRCIPEHIAAQAQLRPEAIAVVWGDQQLTYGELERRANQTAHYLQGLGVQGGTLVGIYVERSLELIVGLLGILKAGGAYVPIDPSYPAARVGMILADTQMPVLLTQASLVPQLPDHGTQVVCLDTDWAQIATGPSDAPGLPTADQLAYVVYTSGSTGIPKGVMIAHRGLLNLVAWHQQAFQVSEADRATQLAGIAFDAAGWEIWPYLAAGATLELVPPDLILQPAALRDWFLAHQISLSFVPTPVAEQLFNLDWPATTPLRMMLVGGDRLTVNPAGRVPFAVVNNYGPTENTVVTTAVVLTADDPRTLPTIGRPIANTQVYCLDAQGQIVPTGVAGELAIGGASLALGYLNRPELTAEKFVAHPLVAGERLYRSGDRGRYLANGQIEYLGRLDEQVKLRGLRIELGEIAAVLGRHPAMDQTVVLAVPAATGQPQLVAYVVPRGPAAVTPAELRQFLAEWLPDYMIPAIFMVLETLPLNPNGKVDKRALPQPDLTELIDRHYVAPRNPLEAQLAKIWAEVLGLPQVGIQDNFFAIGGDSILSLQIVARAVPAGIQLTPKQLFAHQTIGELAAVAGTKVAIVAPQGPVVGPVPLTPIQRWFLAQGLPEPHHFNQTVLLEVPATVSAPLLQEVLGAIVRHHDALRLQFTTPGAGWQQTNAPVGELPTLAVVDLGAWDPAERSARLTEICDQVQASIDLGSGCLLRAVLFQMGAGQPQRLLLVVHHLAVDGVSWRILLADLQTAYQQLSQGEPIALPAKTTPWQQWAAQLTAGAGDFQAELAYWQAQVNPDLAWLPMDRSGENSLSSQQTVAVSLAAPLTQDLLQRVAGAYRTQINDLLLAALAQTICAWSGQSQCPVDLEGHGREELFEDVDISRTVGWFTTMFPVCLSVPATPQPATLIQSIKEQLRAIPQKGIGYGLLRYVEQAASLADQGAAPISFNYLGQFDQILQTGGEFQVASESAGADLSSQGSRQHLLDITGLILDGALQLNWTYSSNLYDRQTIAALGQQFIDNLTGLIEHCLEPTAGGYTPTDFPLARLTTAELAQVVGSDWRQVTDLYPLSPLQQGMLFHSRYAPDAGAYVVQLSAVLEGALEPQIFAQAWQQAIDTYETFRTRYCWSATATPLQVVQRQVELPLILEDWRDRDEAAQQTALAELLAADQRQGFDLEKAPLMRLYLLQLGTDRYQLVWSHHHLLLDGWSLPIVLQRVFASYDALSQGQRLAIDPAPPYRHYIAWLQRQDQDAAAQFWRQELQGFVNPTALPTLKTGDLGYGEVCRTLSPAVTAALQAYGRQHQLTPNTILQGAWALLLALYSGEQDVVFGSTVAGRPPALAEVEKMVGLFINTLPVRVQMPLTATCLDWLKALQDQHLARDRYGYAPLVEMQGWSDIPRGTALFESILVFENYPVQEAVPTRPGDLQIVGMSGAEQNSYPLTVTVTPAQSLGLKLSFDRRQFTTATIEQMGDRLGQLVTALIANPSQSVRSLPWLTPAEQVTIGQLQRGAALETTALCCHHLFEEQVTRTPEALAIEDGPQQLTYQALNQRANQLAHYLRAQGVGPEVLVGICLERSLDLVVGLLAILKAGGAYVPLDPSYPPDRLGYMVTDAQLSFLLTQASLRERLPAHQAQVVEIEQDGPQIALAPNHNPPREVTAANLAYVIYTSGSTGQPKGVQIQHGSVSNFLQAVQRAPGLTSADSLLAVTTISFDIAVLELYLPLICGAKIVLASQAVASDGQRLAELLTTSQATVMQATPATWQLLIAGGWQGSPDLRMLCGGEALSPALARQLSALGGSLWNLYGPTEATVWATTYQVVPEDDCGQSGSLPIGQPFPNIQTYVLDDSLRAVPIGVKGELYIGGDCLARGYLHRPELTAERFIPDPFSADPAARLYRTGDRGRYLPSGELEYVDRLDHQIKLRGFRIELGEVEVALGQHPDLAQAVAVVRNSGASGQLIAYVVAPATAPSPAELRQFLADRLPAYMIPSLFVTLAQLPLTPNGKVDRKALPDPELETTLDVQYQAPQTELESQLATLWSEVLGLAQVGVTDNFFELGGHSLLATQLIGRIRQVLQVELPLSDLFMAPTIQALVPAINAALAAPSGPPLVPMAGDRQGALSFGQQRLWFLQQLDPQTVAYHMPGALRIQGVLQVAALAESFQRLVERHEVFRTTFPAVNGGEPQQVVAPTLAIELPVVDLQGLTKTEQAVEIARLKAVVQATPFDLTQDCLLRLQLLQVAADEYLLLFCLHHIIADGWSIGLLTQELGSFYRAAVTGEMDALPELGIQYLDFAQWQRQVLAGEQGTAQLAYWQEQLAGLPPLLALPTDRSRPAIQTFRGNRVDWQLDGATSRALVQLSQQTGSTLFMTLLAAFQVLLYRSSGQTDIAVGSPIANRNRPEIENLIGFFVNTLVLRSDLSGQPTFRELLAQVRRTALAAYGHQDIPFELVVEALQPERDLSHSPLFQVMLVLQNQPEVALELSGLTLRPVASDQHIAKFDLTLNLAQTEQGLTGIWEYNSDLFDASTIQRWGDHFQTLLAAIVQAADCPIDRLDWMPVAEQQQLQRWQQSSGIPKELCLPQLFEQQVLANPQAIAVVCGEQQLTYGELNDRANQLAHHLQHCGVQTETLVGICMERSIDLIVGILAIIKAGGAYVPLDPTYPAERLAEILADTQLAVILSQAELVDRLPTTQAQVICLARDWEQIAQQPTTNYPTPPLQPTNLAYIIYTSGSTGKPKGVMIPQQGITRLVLETNYVQLGVGDRIAQASNTAFDAATFEIWGALLNGAQLVVVPRDILLSPPALAALLQGQRITVLFLTPALFNQMANLQPTAFGQLRYLIMGGEALDPHWVRVVMAAGGPQHLLNGYGPTESTTFATWYEATDLDPAAITIPIGRPLAQTEIYILDPALQPVPIGIPGELYIGGHGLARGYWQRPELTASRFIPHPFQTASGARLYKTGDLVRYLANGDIEYLGRMDNQVKIRGFRIELDEIAAVLNQHPQVQQAVVTVHNTDTGQKQLLAYLAVAEEIQLTTAEMQQFLAERLPDYMIPVAFIGLGELPLTPNGKVDQRALPVPDLTALLVRDYVAPETELEAQLAEIWVSLLGLERVGITDNFFELGGHSLLATQLISRIQQQYQITLPLQELFMGPTIRNMAQIILESQLGNVDEDDFLARTLAELDDMTDEEAQQLLATSPVETY